MANPDTCRHNIIAPGIDDEGKAYIWCCSCDTDLTDPETRTGRKYEYDIDYNVWVRTPNKENS